MDWNDATHGAVDDAIKGSDIVKNAKTVADIAKQAVDYQRMYGGAIRIPGEGASDADKLDFKAKMEKAGLVPKDKFTDYVRPAKAEEYKYDGEIPADLKVTQQHVDAVKAQAFALGLSNDQFKGMMKASLDTMVGATKVQSDALTAAQTALKTEWGQAFDAKMQLARQAAMKLGGEGAVARIDLDPVFAKGMSELGAAYQESGRTDLQRILPSVETQGEAKVKLAEIRNNRDHPFNNRQKVGRVAYEAAAAEVLRLTNMSLGIKPGKDLMFDEAG
jgi:hypothetical protein